MSAKRRLEALDREARRLGLGKCPGCLHWRGIVVAREERDPMPVLVPCPLCGDVPETVIVEVVVSTREEARAAMARMEGHLR